MKIYLVKYKGMANRLDNFLMFDVDEPMVPNGIAAFTKKKEARQRLQEEVEFDALYSDKQYEYEIVTAIIQ